MFTVIGIGLILAGFVLFLLAYVLIRLLPTILAFAAVYVIGFKFLFFSQMFHEEVTDFVKAPLVFLFIIGLVLSVQRDAERLQNKFNNLELKGLRFREICRL